MGQRLIQKVMYRSRTTKLLRGENGNRGRFLSSITKMKENHHPLLRKSKTRKKMIEKFMLRSWKNAAISNLLAR